MQVNDTPKIHVESPSEEDNSLHFPSQELRTQLSLWGTFSHFVSFAPTVLDLDQCEVVMFMTPDGAWNPRTDVFARNEENICTGKGEQ